MFFTSGRPTRSIRTLNSPRVRVSATTPTSVQPGRKPVSISTTMLSTFLPSRKIDPGSVKASLRVAIVARAARASMMNGSHRTPAKTRMPRPAPPSSSLTRKETLFPAGCHAAPVLLVVRLARRPGPTRAPGYRRRSRGPPPPVPGRTPTGPAARRRRERSQPEAVEQARGEEVGGLGHRQGVQDEDEATRGLGARERVDVGDVRDRIRQGTRPGDVVRHDGVVSRPAASRRPRPAGAAALDAGGPRRPAGGRAPAGTRCSRAAPSGSP